MYAKGLPRDVYHLLAPEEHRTLCGLTVVPIIIDRPVSTSTLHLTPQPPADSKLCKDCERARVEA
jgi:hypothetical protein